MKKIILQLVVVVVLLLWIVPKFEQKKINGLTYLPYGPFNEERVRVDSIYYRVSPAPVVVSVLFFYTLVTPVVLIGYNLYEPVCLKKDFKPGTEGVKK